MNPSPPSKQDPLEELGPRPWLSPRAVVWLLAILLMVGLGALLGGRQAINAWRDYSVKKCVVEAVEHIDAGRWQQASALLNQAYRKNPADPNVLRSIARMLQVSGGDAARSVFFWQQLVNLGAASIDDRASLGAAYLKLGQTGEARKMLGAFSSTECTSRSVMELQSEVLRLDGKIAEADTLLHRALLLEPDNPECTFKLALLDLSNPFEESKAAAVEKLWALARSRGAISLRAIELLSSNARLTAAQSAELVDLMSKNSAATERHRGIVLSAYLRLHPQERERIFERETSLQQGKPQEETLDFLRWLIVEQEHARVLHLVSKAQVLNLRQLVPIYVEALAGSRQWGALRDAMRAPSALPLSPVETSLLQARCSHGLGESSSQTRSHLQEACRRAVAAHDPAMLQRASAIAESLGYLDVALDGYLTSAARPETRLPALKQILSIRIQQRDPGAIIGSLQDILLANPSERSHLEFMLYLKLLIGLEMESSGAQISTLLREGRISAESARFLGAFVAFRIADMGALRTQLSEIHPEDLTVGQRAVYAGLLATCGEKSRAFVVGEKVLRPLLLPEEDRLLMKAL